MQSRYLNPENEELDEDGYYSDDLILNRVPSVFLLLGSIYGIIQVKLLTMIDVVVHLSPSLKNTKIFSFSGHGYFTDLGPSIQRGEFHDGTRT